MGDPANAGAVKVGVLLPEPSDLGGWLADAAAFDTAGADALWIDVPPHGPLDPLALAAALSALTFRALLVTPLPGPGGEGRAPARTLTTISRLSRGRLAVYGEARQVADITAAGGPEARAWQAFQPLGADLIVRTAAGGGQERWARTAAPQSRAGWQATVADAAARGIGGLLVPADDRLIDLLRNPGDTGDRRDLHLAQG
jgi:hypothetical protein